jgi:hypothetical protein
MQMAGTMLSDEEPGHDAASGCIPMKRNDPASERKAAKRTGAASDGTGGRIFRANGPRERAGLRENASLRGVTRALAFLGGKLPIVRSKCRHEMSGKMQ